MRLVKIFRKNTLCALLFFATTLHAEPTLVIATAADFASTLDQIVGAFKKNHSVNVEISVGASGNLYQQIMQGAPFNLFFSADQAYVQKLAEQHFAEPKTTKSYAQGVLVLWSKETLNCKNISENFIHQNGKIVLANPGLAPYGKVGKTALKNLNLYTQLQPRLVFANDIGQAAWFLENNAAQLALVSQASVLTYQHKHPAEKQQFCAIPQNLYAPLIQAVAVIKQSENTQMARSFFDFLQSSAAQKIILQAGYQIPRR